jgi:hypothetical protein
MFQAADASLRYDATVRSGNPGGRSAPLRPKHLRGCPRGARSQPSRGPALRSGWLSAPLAFIGGRRSPLQRATAHADAPKALVTPAGCARRRRDRGATPEFWVEGLPPKNGARWERSKNNRRPAAGAEAGAGESP